MLELPETFQQTIIGVHGERGAEWLQRLPDTISKCEARWNIEIKQPFSNLSYNLVLSARQADGQKAVVKLGVPHAELTNEINALLHFKGQGFVRLLDYDLTLGAMLLEYLQPGTPLSKKGDDHEATLIFVQVLKRMKRMSPSATTDFPTLSDWARGFERLRLHYDGHTGPLPIPMVQRAERLYAELLKTTTHSILLHGDLHQDNILLTKNGEWIVIDPKGVIGDPCFEVIPFLRNHLLKQAHPDRVLAERVNTVCQQLGYERQRVLSWGLAHCVLSSWWSIEDGVQGWENDFRCAELFESLIEGHS